MQTFKNRLKFSSFLLKFSSELLLTCLEKSVILRPRKLGNNLEGISVTVASLAPFLLPFLLSFFLSLFQHLGSILFVSVEGIIISSLSGGSGGEGIKFSSYPPPHLVCAYLFWNLRKFNSIPNMNFSRCQGIQESINEQKQDQAK